MKELEPGLLFFMEVEIDSSKATGETPEILKELETFYEVDIPWDSPSTSSRPSVIAVSKNSSSISQFQASSNSPSSPDKEFARLEMPWPSSPNSA